VHQHSHLVERHSVLETLLVGWQARNFAAARRDVMAAIKAIREAYCLWLEPGRPVASLSMGERQRLDIIKALSRKARILILDEPTSVLTPLESEALFAAVRALQADGVAVILISHKLHEVLAIANRIVVMRRGRVVAEREKDGSLMPRDLAELMCGTVPPVAQPLSVKTGPIRLDIAGLRLTRANGLAAPIGFDVAAGEIVGLAGVSGNGQVALAETLAGLLPLNGATLKIDGSPVIHWNPIETRRRGVAYIPEDRIGAGFAGTLSLAENLALGRHNCPPLASHGWLDRKAMERQAKAAIAALDIRPPDAHRAIALFSGGNQQKAIIARELLDAPRVLIIAQPTRGLDVAATAFVHQRLQDVKAAGTAILLICDDLDEILTLSDRILVMSDGTITARFSRREASLSELGLAMAGRKLGAAA
jgi:ABC-type uncharacterized transport system ATPase subunit